MAGIYIHIPFCIHKCYYCDFYSIINTSFIENYITFFLKEIEHYNSIYDLKNYKINSLYFGGGTPSLLNINQFERVFEKLYEYFFIDNDIEITIEANPNTIDKEFLKSLRAINVNRISIGIQSFRDKELRFLQRTHTSKDAIEAIETALLYFENVSIDLIFGIPIQTQRTWLESVIKSLSYNIHHLSLYNLIYEINTPLYHDFQKGIVKKKRDEEEEKMYFAAVELLTGTGFEHYEISNFAKNNKKCIHNIAYWKCEEYFGFGPSSSGFIDNKRYTNKKDLNEYIVAIQNGDLPIETTETLDKKKKIDEYIMLRLRSFGIDIEEFKRNFGIDLFERNFNFISELEKNNFLTIKDGFIKLTTKGYFVCNAITIYFLEVINKKMII